MVNRDRVSRFSRPSQGFIAHTRAGIEAFLAPSEPNETTYTQGSAIGLLAVMLTLAIIPDAIFLLLVIPRALLWLSVLFGAFDIWSCLWLIALYGSMATSPHELSSERIVLRNGLLQEVEFAPHFVREVRSLGRIKRRQIPRSQRRDAAFLGFGGVPIVEVTLERPAAVRQSMRSRVRDARRIFVATDRPEAFCQRLQQLAFSQA